MVALLGASARPGAVMVASVVGAEVEQGAGPSTGGEHDGLRARFDSVGSGEVQLAVVVGC
jgi:hypothetical protein